MNRTRDFFIAAGDVFHKSRQSFHWVILSGVVASLLILSACGNDEIQLPDKELEGMIDGKEWTYKSANAFLLSTNLQYRVRFLSDKESVTDPCTLPGPGLSHAKAIFKPFIGSFVVAPQAIEDNQVQVAFELSPSKSLIASSGFMEIYDINGQVIFGYLQAVLDDENTVEGSFQIRICN